MLRLRVTAASLPLGLLGPGGVTDYLEWADLPARVGESREIVVRGERIGRVTRIRQKRGKGKGSRPHLFDVGPEWEITRANARIGEEL